MADYQHLIGELKRRRVFRALAGWGIASFAILQVIEPVLHAYHLPDWTLTLVVTALGAGFPVTAILAWVFDLTARGIVRTATATGEPPGGGGPAGLRLALPLLGLGLLAAAPGLVYFFVWPGSLRAPAAAGAAADAAAPSIAVLPFADMSAARDQEYFSDGIAEEILSALAQVPGLRVVGRTSSFAFKGRNEGLAAIAQQLHVGALLEGSVRKEGSRVRVTAQLVNASDGFHVWSQTFDRELTGIFAVQDEIARAVVQALEVKLLPGQRPSRAGARTTNPEAYRLYLLGRQLMPLGTAEGFRGSVEALERSVELDPAYAPAQAWLAFGTWWQAVLGTGDMTGQNTRALARAERAVALGPDLADGYAIRGVLRSLTSWDWAGARADYERALALAPGDVTTQANFALLVAATGRLPDALRLAQRATELDPLSPVALRWLGVLQSADGHPELAEATFRRGLEVAPGNAYLLRELGFADLVEGKGREALELFEHHPVDWMRLLGRAMAHHQLGHEAESRRALEALVATASAAAAYQIAQVHAWRGEKDQALDWLERAYATNDSGLRYVRFDPFLRGLHAEPRYQALLRKMNLPVD